MEETNTNTDATAGRATGSQPTAVRSGSGKPNAIETRAQGRALVEGAVCDYFNNKPSELPRELLAKYQLDAPLGMLPLGVIRSR